MCGLIQFPRLTAHGIRESHNGGCFSVEARRNFNLVDRSSSEMIQWVFLTSGTIFESKEWVLQIKSLASCKLI